MLLSHEFQLTKSKNSHQTRSEARSTHEHAPTSCTQPAKHANDASHTAREHHICTVLHMLPACLLQHCNACELAPQPSGHWTFSLNQPKKQTKAKLPARTPTSAHPTRTCQNRLSSAHPLHSQLLKSQTSMLTTIHSGGVVWATSLISE